MGRAVRDSRLDKRDARIKLEPRKEPYWRLITEGCHLGYYRGSRSGKWVARHRLVGSKRGYLKTTIGEADDVRNADGTAILNFAQAQEAARLWFLNLGSSARGKTAKATTVGEALDDYMRGFAGKGIDGTRYRIEALIRPKLGHIVVTDLTRKVIADWHRDRAAAPARVRSKNGEVQQGRAAVSADAIRKRRSTANRDLTVLKAALNRLADDREDLPVTSWRDVKPFKNVEAAKLRFLTDDESRALVAATTIDFKGMVQAALLTGARYSELTRLRVRDLDVAASIAWLHETKAGVPRVVHLEGEGMKLFIEAAKGKAPDALLFCRPDGTAWGVSHQRRRMIAACLSAAIEPATFHDLRRTYGARLARKGVPMTVIAKALGHSDERITQRHYAHLSPDYVGQTIRENANGLGIVA